MQVRKTYNEWEPLAVNTNFYCFKIWLGYVFEWSKKDGTECLNIIQKY